MVPEPGLNGPDPGQPSPSVPPNPGAPVPPQEPDASAHGWTDQGWPAQPPVPGYPQPQWGYPPAPYPPAPAYYGVPQPTGPAPKPPALPTTPREYHEFFRAARYRWWKSLLALAMFVATWLVGNLVLTGTALGVDIATGRTKIPTLQPGTSTEQLMNDIMTPLMFTANNLSLALAIPLAGLTGWAVFGQRPKWISSITGGFRWGLFARFSMVAVPIFLLGLGVDILLGGMPTFTWNNDSLFLIFAIILTTPFQAAGEEYGVRGLIARSVGSWFGSRRLGLVVAAVASSALFMVLHAADNVWLNIYYFTVGLTCSVLIWRTGGLEAAVALHVWNNLISEVTIPFGGLQGMFDRGANAVGPEILFQLVFTLSVMAAALWIGRRLGLPRATAPAVPTQAELPGPGGVFWDSSRTIA